MLKKKEITFITLRYFSFILMAARGLLLAYYLGPLLLGVYGYIMLYQQYLSYSSLGLNYSINSELAVLKDDNKDEEYVLINSAFTGLLYISFFIILISILIYYLKIQLFPFTESYKYVLILAPLSILINFQQIFVNVFRVQKKLTPIILGECLLSIGLFLLIFFFKGVTLINVVFYGWIVILFLTIIIYNVIYEGTIRYNNSKIKYLLKSGLPLLIYVFSYYLMNLLVRTLIGSFYPLEVMGYFSFANNITTAIMLGLDTITWVIFPSIISKLSDLELNKKDLEIYLVQFSDKLNLVVLIIVSLSIILLPILFLILPKYQPVQPSLIILLINQILFNSGFVFISLFIARKMYVNIAVISLVSVLLGSFFSLIFCYYKLPYIWLVVANVISSLSFLNILVYYTCKVFNVNYKNVQKSLDFKLQLILCFIVIACLFNSYYLVLFLLTAMFIYKFNSFIDLKNQLMETYQNRKTKVC